MLSFESTVIKSFDVPPSCITIASLNEPPTYYQQVYRNKLAAILPLPATAAPL